MIMWLTYSAYRTYWTKITSHIRGEILSALKMDLYSITMLLYNLQKDLIKFATFSDYTTRGLLLSNRDIEVLKRDGECETEIIMKNKNEQLFIYIVLYILW